MVSLERWQQAQEQERKQHTLSYDDGVVGYKQSYDNYFKYFGITYNHSGKRIVEIGCADFPALQHCKTLSSTVIEPMPSEILKRICTEHNIALITQPAEYGIPECDEVWLMNVLQHVIDPDLIVQRCKESAKLIRFFEPLNYPADVCHPNILTGSDFKRWFGEYKIYDDKLDGFHQWECAYGEFKVK